MDINFHTLKNNLRLVTRHCESPVEYFGVSVNAGSRDETTSNEGLAHFVEHTIFKGTAKRRSWHIINRMEAVGGELNAYTTKEETMIYSIFPAGNIDRAAELIADLISNSRFPESEIDKEREVVADEINSYLDTPSENVFDEFEDNIFKHSSLGHNILGNTTTVERFSTLDCREWLTKFYTTSNMVVFYMGPGSHERIMHIVSRYFSEINREKLATERIEPKVNEIFDLRHDCGNHQAHTVMGTRVPGMYWPYKRALSLLSNIIGGPGMNSMLNVELRERRGLVYSVDSTLSTFTDSGLLEIYFGCDPEDTNKCRKRVIQTLRHIYNDGITVRNLEAAKKQYIGQLVIASENKEQLSLSTGRAALYNLKIQSLEDIIEEINQIDENIMSNCYPLLNPDNFSILTLS